MNSENYYILVLKNGEICDFDERCESLEENIPNVITFRDKYGLYLAAIPRDSIWAIFNSVLENQEPFKMFTFKGFSTNPGVLSDLSTKDILHEESEKFRFQNMSDTIASSTMTQLGDANNKI